MKEVPWEKILEAADAATDVLPIPVPANLVIDFAIAIALFFVRQGCSISGCPADIKVKLQPADIPAEDIAMFKAKADADVRVRGLDRASIEKKFWSDKDEVLEAQTVVDPQGDLADYLSEIGHRVEGIDDGDISDVDTEDGEEKT